MKAHALLCLFLSLLLSSSCVTRKKCYRLFPPSRDTVKVIQIKDSIIYHDTTIFVPIKGKDTTIFSEIPYPVHINAEKIRSETQLAWAEAWIINSRLMLKLVQKDTTIMIQLDSARKEAYHWKSEYEKINVVPPPPDPVRYIPSFYKFCFWVVIVLIILIVGYAVKKFNLLSLLKTFIK